MKRSAVPDQIPQLTRFSDDAKFASYHHLIATVKGMPWVWWPVQAVLNRRYKWGPARMAGDWGLVYLAFSISRIPDVEPWYQRVCEDAAFWKLCGFVERPGPPPRGARRRLRHGASVVLVPTYPLVLLRLKELQWLEEEWQPFRRAAARLMQEAHGRDPRVGAHWHVDGTEAETHAAPHHDCRPEDPCPTRDSTEQPHLTRLDTGAAGDLRRAMAKLPEESLDEPFIVDGLTIELIESVQLTVNTDGMRGCRFESGGHFWFSRDPDAGTRAYHSSSGTLKKAWHGYSVITVVDHLTHGPLAIFIIPANKSEVTVFPVVVEQASANLGGVMPVAIGADRGNSSDENYDLCSSLGITLVIPYRKRNRTSPDVPVATDRLDEHGVPLCRACGREAEIIRSYVDRGRGRVDFTCQAPVRPRCSTTQHMYCDQDSRRLIMQPRNGDLYAAMTQSGLSFEHKHRDLRIQYKVAPKCLADRPKIVGMVWQQLRANVAMLIDWLRIYVNLGWVEGDAPIVTVPTKFEKVAGKIAGRRARLGRTGGARRHHPPPPATD